MESSIAVFLLRQFAYEQLPIWDRQCVSPCGHVHAACADSFLQSLKTTRPSSSLVLPPYCDIHSTCWVLLLQSGRSHIMVTLSLGGTKISISPQHEKLMLFTAIGVSKNN